MKEIPSISGLDKGICTVTNIRKCEESKKPDTPVISFYTNH